MVHSKHVLNHKNKNMVVFVVPLVFPFLFRHISTGSVFLHFYLKSHLLWKWGSYALPPQKAHANTFDPLYSFKSFFFQKQLSNKGRKDLHLRPPSFFGNIPQTSFQAFSLLLLLFFFLASFFDSERRKCFHE